jgi:biopolymer transport protein ExbD
MKYFEVKKARIEIIPMIDIMFFLLVFFIMVTLHMIPDAGIASRLPTSSTAQSMPKPQITLAVDKAGVIHFDQKTLTSDQLTALLKSKPQPDELQVTLAGDKDTSLQQLMAVMDACRRAGVTKIGLAAQQGGGEDNAAANASGSAP